MNKLNSLTSLPTYGPWFVDLVSIIEGINPLYESSWASRLDVEIQSKLSAYNIALGTLYVEARLAYNKYLEYMVDNSKSVASAKIHAEASEQYAVFRYLEQYHLDINSLIYSLRHESKNQI
jgi:hypothetical protein